MLFLLPMQVSTETVTEEILDQELQEEEFSDTEDPTTIPEPEQEEPQTSTVSNKYAGKYIPYFTKQKIALNTK